MTEPRLTFYSRLPSVRGMLALTVVPSGPENISSCPPSCRTRSRIPRMPTPKVRASRSSIPTGATVFLGPVFDLNERFVMFDYKPNTGRFTCRVAMNVRQAFLEYAKQREFYVRRQAPGIIRRSSIIQIFNLVGPSVQPTETT